MECENLLAAKAGSESVDVGRSLDDNETVAVIQLLQERTIANAHGCNYGHVNCFGSVKENTSAEVLQSCSHLTNGDAQDCDQGPNLKVKVHVPHQRSTEVQDALIKQRF